tara:strand:- start:1220 stop:2002 length:783 start_codon:yes stop_codon:yes gene_type:complete
MIDTFAVFYKNRLLQESIIAPPNNTRELDRWATEVVKAAETAFWDTEDKEYKELGTLEQGQRRDSNSNRVRELVAQYSPKAYTYTQRFHELEYKLHVLKKNYPHETQLIDFTISEINQFYNWLKVFFITIIDTRVVGGDGGGTGPGEANSVGKQDLSTLRQYVIQKYDADDDSDDQQIMDGGKFTNEAWKSLGRSYILLGGAKTLQEKIIAITMALNAWHDNAALMSPDYFWGPFTMEQYEQIGNINTRKVHAEIERDFN